MASWTLTYTSQSGAAVSKPLDEWEITNPTIDYVNQAPDKLIFFRPQEELNEQETFQYGGQVELIHSVEGRQFLGYVVDVGSQGSGKNEGRRYECNGLWWKLEELVFCRTLQLYASLGSTVGSLETTHHLLNSVAGRVVVRDQIKEVLDYAAAKGVPIAYDDASILPLWTTLQPNISEVRDLACSEVIRQQLRWFPSAVTRFDYTQNPPKLEILTRPEMQAVSLELEPENDPGYQITEWDLRSRPDLVRSKVMIRYERRDSLNGKQILRLFDDVYPAGAFAPEAHALVMTIDQRGPDSQETLAEVEMRRALPLTEDWWLENYGERLTAEGVTNFTIDPDTLRIKGPDDEYSVPWQDSIYQAYVSEIVDGQAAEWMLTGSGLPMLSVNLTFYIVAEWEETEPVNIGTTKLTRKGGPVQLEHSNNFCTYVLPSGIDQAVVPFWNRSSTPGDPQIFGLAEALHAQLSILQYDGSVTIHEEECGFRARMGNTLNLLGVRPEYASMVAQIQSVRLDLSSGNTMLTLGPARALGATDLIDLLQ